MLQKKTRRLVQSPSNLDKWVIGILLPIKKISIDHFAIFNGKTHHNPVDFGSCDMFKQSRILNLLCQADQVFANWPHGNPRKMLLKGWFRATATHNGALILHGKSVAVLGSHNGINGRTIFWLQPIPYSKTAVKTRAVIPVDPRWGWKSCVCACLRKSTVHCMYHVYRNGSNVHAESKMKGLIHIRCVYVCIFIDTHDQLVGRVHWDFRIHPGWKIWSRATSPAREHRHLACNTTKPM